MPRTAKVLKEGWRFRYLPENRLIWRERIRPDSFHEQRITLHINPELADEIGPAIADWLNGIGP